MKSNCIIKYIILILLILLLIKLTKYKRTENFAESETTEESLIEESLIQKILSSIKHFFANLLNFDKTQIPSDTSEMNSILNGSEVDYEEPAPVEEPTPVEELPPVEEPTPVKEPPPVKEPTPVVKSLPLGIFNTSKTYSIRARNKKQSSYKKYLSWTTRGNKAKMYSKPLKWQFVQVPGKTNQYYIINTYKCPKDGRCGYGLSWSNNRLQIVKRSETTDVPWEFKKYGKYYYLINKYNNCSKYKNCDYYVYTSGTSVKLSKKSSKTVYWEIK
jgi:hypothetical protein